MSEADNGGRRPPRLAALVIESDVQSQLELRSAIRATGLFSTILSAETALVAHDTMNGADAYSLDLVLVASTMLPALALGFGPGAASARFVIVAEAKASVPDVDWPILRKPVCAADIERLFVPRD